ncbi:MAG TPA: hypothetical protein VL326_05585 [Kofleriaceae bacterium]|nr:hypothetical protein [Kofleriaceae bacterium]
MHDGSLVFTMTSSTPPALGALAVKASLFEIDQGLTSNTVTASVNVVAP